MSVSRILFLLLIPLFVEILIACCNCPETTYRSYTNCGITLSNIDNAGKELVVTESINISQKVYGIQVEIQFRENSCSILPKHSSILSTASAFRCACEPEIKYDTDSIVGIKVFTINPFDTSHDALADISEYFRVYQYGRFQTINEFLSTLQSSKSYFLDEGLALLLITPPSLGPEHQFRVSIELSDGRIIEANTVELILE